MRSRIRKPACKRFWGRMPTDSNRAAASPAQVLRGEQSNTSLRFGDAVIVKLFR